MQKKEKSIIIIIVGLFAFFPIIFFTIGWRQIDAHTIEVLLGYMALPFSGIWVGMSFVAIGDLVGNDSSSLRNNTGMVLLSVFILWASFPLIFKVLKGIKLWRRILYMWMFSVQLSWPLFYVYVTVTNSPMTF